jgi:hypothetical protein
MKAKIGFNQVSASQCDRALGAVLLGGDGMLLEFAGDVLDEDDRVSDLIGVEDVGRQGVAAPVTGATVSVDADTSHDIVTANVSGSDSTDLRPPV